MARASINRVIEADQRLEDVLEEMRHECDDDVYLPTKAICVAIQAAAIRIDYVISKATRIDSE